MGKKINYGTVTKEAIRNYNGWLEYSKISEGELLKLRNLKPVDVVKNDLFNGAFSIQLTIGNKSIGEPFVSPAKEYNENFIFDVSFVLLYIAERLDEANRKNPPLGFCKSDKDYFYMTVKQIVKNLVS
jgi:hypothetical protein